MKDEPTNSFKEAEKIELVSKSESFNPSVVEPEQGATASSTHTGSTGSVTSSARPTDETPPDQTLTPWKKRRDPGAHNRKKLVLIVLIITILAPLLAVISAISCVPNGYAVVELHTGLALGNRPLILDGFKRGWNNDPAQVGTLIQVANLRADVDRTAAIELYNDCVRINPNLANCYMNRGLNYTYLQQYDLAMADYDKAIQLNPRYSLALNNRACLYQHLGKYSMALKDHDRAIAAGPAVAFYYYNRAFTYRLLNKHAESLKDFLKCQSLGYDEPALQRNIDDARSHLQ